MTSVSTRFIALSLLVNLLVCAASSSFSGQFILDIFGNPVKDLRNTFIKTKETPTANSVLDKSTEGGKSDTKMIDVPPNTERCDRGTVMDVNGVCRQPW